MVTHNDLINLTKMWNKSLTLAEEQLVSFVKGAAIRAYKAGSAPRKNEDVDAKFNAQTKQLRLIVKKKVVAQVKDNHKECTQADGKSDIGEIASIEVTDQATYKSIDAAFEAMKKLVAAHWKKENSMLVKTKFQEMKQKCVPAIVAGSEGKQVLVRVSEMDCFLPADEQIKGESYELGKELVVYVKELKEEEGAADLIVSRKDAALVSYVMRRNIPEVDVGSIQIKAVARLAGSRSRVAVWSKNFGPTERCQKRAAKVSSELGGETIDFIEWYLEVKAYIASALKVEARDVHVIESEKQALVEVFKDSAEQALDGHGEAIKLASELTGYKIEVKLVARDESTNLPGV